MRFFSLSFQCVHSLCCTFTIRCQWQPSKQSIFGFLENDCLQRLSQTGFALSSVPLVRTMERRMSKSSVFSSDILWLKSTDFSSENGAAFARIVWNRRKWHHDFINNFKRKRKRNNFGFSTMALDFFAGSCGGEIVFHRKEKYLKYVHQFLRSVWHCHWLSAGHRQGC